MAGKTLCGVRHLSISDAGEIMAQRGEKAGVMASEMETSTLFVVSSIRGTKAGAIMAYGEMNDNTIEVACEAIKLLIEKNKK